MSTQTVHQTRRDRLELLIAEHGSIAALNSAMGMRRDDATFSLIRNQNTHSATKKPRVMGDELARKVEATLGLPVGWLDTPVSTVDARIEHVVEILQSMSEPLRDQAVRVVDALAAADPKPGEPMPGPAAPASPPDKPAPTAARPAADGAKGAPTQDKGRSDRGRSDADSERHAMAHDHPDR